MKKLLYILMLLPMMLLASCSDDDSLPNVDISIQLSNVFRSEDGRLYAPENNTVQVDRISIKGNEGKNALISSVQYAINNRIVGWTPVSPFEFRFVVNGTGLCMLSTNMEILQEDKSVALASVDLDIHVVADEESLPDNIIPDSNENPVVLTYLLSARPK